jgi:long-chain acyl-CoA synthetase
MSTNAPSATPPASSRLPGADELPGGMPWFAHYEKGVPRTIAESNKTLQDLLSDSAAKFPNNIAGRMVLKYLPLGLTINSRVSYKELDALTSRFAAALQGLGIKKGDRVAIMLPNCPQVLVAYFGILKAGAIVVNINPTYPTTELKHVLADCRADAIVMLSGLVERLLPVREEVGMKHIIVTDMPDTLSWPFNSMVAKTVRASGLMKDVTYGNGVHRFSELMEGAPSKPTAVAVSPDDVVLFQYTGGTTGIPKAAMLTHRNLVANCLQMDAWFTGVEYGKEKMLLALPSFHVYGMTVGMLFGITCAAEVILVPDPRNTAHIIDVISHERVSLYPGVPAMYIGIINHPKAKEVDLRSIKACLSGGSALPVEVAQQFEQLTGGKLVEGFGMTECSPVANANPIFGEVRAGSVGLPISSTVCAICALEPEEDGKFKLLGVGEEGELILKGPQVMKGYWGRDDETAVTIDSEGWLHTGDIAKMDADGYFYIVDRKKDLIIASGFNIVPREVEEVLFQHPKILEAAVAGIPDPKRGETVKAYVVFKEGQTATGDELRAFCKEHLAPYKVPTSFEVRKELPRTQAGKVLRRQLVQEELEKQAAAK